MRKFINPEMEISAFDVEDIIATSGNEAGGDGDSTEIL